MQPIRCRTRVSVGTLHLLPTGSRRKAHGTQPALAADLLGLGSPTSSVYASPQTEDRIHIQ